MGEIFQSYFICLNYESRVKRVVSKDVKFSNTNSTANSTRKGLFIQYGIETDSEDKMHLYMSYFDQTPLEPIYYSFGSRDFRVEVLNARIETLSEVDQIKLRCRKASKANQAITTYCDYKCHHVCEGCFEPFKATACKKCAFASLAMKNPETADISAKACLGSILTAAWPLALS